MRNQVLLLLCTIGMLGIWSGCNDTYETLPDDQLELSYFPTDIGKTWTYQVDSTIYSNFASTTFETTSYIHDEVIDMNVDASGEERYVIRRSWRRSLEAEWKVKDIWFMSRSNTQASQTVENIRTINLLFPPREGTQWDGNSFIREGFIVVVGGENIEMYKNWNYEILGEAKPELIGLLNFDEVLEVQQANDENAIELRYSIEKYAKGVGLVYKEQKILDTQCIEQCDGQPWEEKAQKGFILRQTIVDFQ